MSYVTKNVPDPKLVAVLEKLPSEDLYLLVTHCKAGNFGIISTAAQVAKENQSTKTQTITLIV